MLVERGTQIGLRGHSRPVRIVGTVARARRRRAADSRAEFHVDGVIRVVDDCRRKGLSSDGYFDAPGRLEFARIHGDEFLRSLKYKVCPIGDGLQYSVVNRRGDEAAAVARLVLREGCKIQPRNLNTSNCTTGVQCRTPAPASRGVHSHPHFGQVHVVTPASFPARESRAKGLLQQSSCSAISM